MRNLILIDPVAALFNTLELLSFIGGWVMKGFIGAVASELVFRPVARKVKAKGQEWETTHPQLHAWALHFLEGHYGHRPTQCQHGCCERIS
jgi:hypothetical protein